ncbi:MAG: tandem-95 repeat protein, partial [Candidatus Thermoplasmatota archaeon]|nr:tandem-95 repeat protein [Candidatus Thermoplasmatota archaeon]
RIATITAPTGWIGQETITFTATDPENLSDTDTATFAITIGNYPPQVDDIPDQTINEGQQFTTINLNNYVTDVEDPDANIQWTTTGTFDLIITISPAKIATITIPHTNWAGSELITFIATDTGSLTDSDQALFTVNLVNDPPQVLDIPAQTISEGGTFTQIQLDSYVTDIDNLPSEITWTATGQTDLLITILPTRIAIIEPPNTTWNGAETITFTATDPGSLSDSDSATFTVIAGNDPPIVDDIPDQSINEGQTFSQINLDNYVTDEEDSDENITWTYTGNSYLQVTITNRIATITSPNPEWNGLEAITFIATDTAQLSDSDIALFEILPQNDPPIANDDTYNVNENSHNNLLHPLTNDTDIDGDTLRIISITQPSQGNATHDDTTITYTPPSNYTGTTTLTYTITDDNGSTDTATITIIIQTNDPPNTPTTPTGPTSGYTSQTYSFTTSSIDPEAHSITYGWDFNNDDIIDTWTPAYPSGDQATITTSWQAIGTYQIKVKARDTLSKESPWSTTHTITITKKTSSGGGGGGPLPPANLPPIADASAGAPYHTTINTPILLNASESYDQDGTITTWTWTIGDITKQGITTIHTFINEGSYTIKLTVIDNGGSSNSDSFNIDIIKPNSPPIITSIKAPTQLPKDTEGQITLHATDDNNDLIEYIINWGDTTTETSPYTPTSTNITLTHSWNTPGIYHITIIAHDNHNPQENHTSEPITKIIMIDAWDLSHHINGYLIDTNSDGIYDIYFNNDLDQQTAIARELNGTYRINIDGDNSWDYWYDINIDTLQPYNVVILQTETFPLAIIILLGLFLILLFVLILGQLKKQKTQKTAKKKNPPKKTSNSKKTKSTATKKSKTTKKK